MVASANTFESIWNEVHGHSKAVDPLLVQSWVRDTWREIAESYQWSWLRRKSVVSIPAPYTTGTVACTPGSRTITFTGATLTQAMQTRQFRVGSGAIYDILSLDTSANTALIDPPWTDTTSAVSAQAYKIFTAYIRPPAEDFFAWLSVSDPTRRRRLRLHVNNEEIDFYDAGRRMTALGPSCLSGVDWSTGHAGKVGSVLTVSGSGPAPTSSGVYGGQTDSIMIVKITTGGPLETARFSFQKDNGTVFANNVVSESGSALPEGVGLSWGAGTYVNGNIFAFRLTAKPQYGVPRYELYPHHTAALYLPCVYSTRVRDIDEPDFILPYTMRSDLIKVGALAKMARYPGTADKPNPYSQIARAQAMEEKFDIMLGELRTADDYIMETNVINSTEQWEWALLPWMSTSGSGMRRTAEYDPMDLLL